MRKPLDLEVVVPVEDMGELGKVIDPEVLAGHAAGDPEVRHSIWPVLRSPTCGAKATGASC